MLKRYGLIVVLVMLLTGGSVTLLGDLEENVSLSSVLEIWGDVLRDADQFGLRLTRVSDREEMELGEEISRSISWRENPEWTTYVSAVGKTLLPYVRRTGIRYEFRAIESPQINAFALPGGRVFVMTGMLEFLDSEAELAAILGHEISHVDLRHCIERFQYERSLARVGVGGLGQITDITRRFIATGYNKYQELEADAQGVRLSIEAGYDPDAGATVFNRLQLHYGTPEEKRARTPIAEIGRVVGQAMGSYFQSHPTSETRTRQLNDLIERNRRRLQGRHFYVGVQNFRQRLPRSQQEFPSERRSL